MSENTFLGVFQIFFFLLRYKQATEEDSAAFNTLNYYLSECLLFIAGCSFHHLGAGFELLNFTLHHVHSSFTVPIFLLSLGSAASGFIINTAVTIPAFSLWIGMNSADENFPCDKALRTLLVRLLLYSLTGNYFWLKYPNCPSQYIPHQRSCKLFIIKRTHLMCRLGYLVSLHTGGFHG